MKKELFIPNDIVLGYQKREDAMTGILGYIVYKKNNKIAKEHSWNKWRDKSIESKSFKNEPTSGFLISKDITRQSFSYHSYKRTVMRIHDPRGWDFEISIRNLCFLLECCNLNNGEIEGEFVYSWDGKDLVLLPSKSVEYKKSFEYSQNENKKISAKDLILGATYQTKGKVQSVIYLGRHELFKKNEYKNDEVLRNKIFRENIGNSYLNQGDVSILGKYYHSKGKQHIFYNIEKQEYQGNITSRLSICLDEEMHDDFENIHEEFVNSKFHNKINNIYLSDKIKTIKDVSQFRQPDFFLEYDNKLVKIEFNVQDKFDGKQYYITNIYLCDISNNAIAIRKNHLVERKSSFSVDKIYPHETEALFKLYNKNPVEFEHAVFNNDLSFFEGIDRAALTTTRLMFIILTKGNTEYLYMVRQNFNFFDNSNVIEKTNFEKLIQSLNLKSVIFENEKNQMFNLDMKEIEE